MNILSNGMNYSSHKPGKAWKLFQNYKAGAFGLTVSIIEQIETDLYMEKIPYEQVRIYITKEGNTSWTEVYIKN